MFNHKPVREALALRTSDWIAAVGVKNRAVNSHALSVSFTPGHFFSRSHAKHVKSPEGMQTSHQACKNLTHQGKHNLFFFFLKVKTDTQV